MAFRANEPAGSVTMLNWDCSTTDANGQLWELYPGSAQIGSDAGDPVSPSGVTQSILYPNAVHGGQQTIWPKNTATALPLREMYVALTWKCNSDFEGNVVGNKLFFVAAQDWTYGLQPSNGVFVMQGPRYGPWQLNFSHNTGSLNNVHVCGADNIGNTCFGSNAVPLVRNTWYTIEVYLKASSTATSRDGAVKAWINETQVINVTNLNYSGVVNQFQINHTWDGSFGYQPYNASTNPLGRDSSKMWVHSFGHVYISAPNWNGSAPPPPPPPPPPDEQPNGLLAPPSGLSPNGATLAPGPITVSWSQVPGATAYLIRVHKGGTPYDPCESMVICRQQTANSVTFNADANSTYDWWVHSVNSLGFGTSNGASFSTSSGGAPPPPSPSTITALEPTSPVLNVGDSQTLTVAVSDTSANLQVVSLANSHPSSLSVPGSVSIPIGELSVSFTITALAQGSGTITASLNNSAKTSSFFVQAPTLPPIDPNPPVTPPAPIQIVQPSNPLTFVGCHKKRA